MATTDELIAQIANEPEVYSTSSDINYITVDTETRLLTIPASESIFGVYQDKDWERKYFKFPRIAGDENVDISTCTVLVNYVSASGTRGQYLCNDVLASDDDNVTFSWRITSNVIDRNTDSTVGFAIQVLKPNEYGGLENVFNTRPAYGKTYETIVGSAEIVEENPDVINEILAQLTSLEEAVNSFSGGSYSDWSEEEKDAMFDDVVSRLETLGVGSYSDWSEEEKDTMFNDVMSRLETWEGGSY